MGKEGALRWVRLGRSPVEVPPLAIGCWSWGDSTYWLGETALDGRDVVAAFATAVRTGLTFFDTAESYGWGRSEKLLGALARRARRPVVIASKYAPLSGRGGGAALTAGIEESLGRLGVAAIDLYQLHWADREELPIGEAMRVLAEAVRAGRIRAVGVSNFRAAELSEAHAALARHGVPLACQQVEYSLISRSPEIDGVLELCRELEITLLAYSPLAQGLLADRYSSSKLPPGARGQSPRFRDNLLAAQPLLDFLRAIASSHDVDPAAVALAWLLARRDVVPIVGAHSAEQVASAARALDLTLSAAEVAKLDELSQPWLRVE